MIPKSAIWFCLNTTDILIQNWVGAQQTAHALLDHQSAVFDKMDITQVCKLQAVVCCSNPTERGGITDWALSAKLCAICFVGVDIFGPFYVTVGCASAKRHGVFTHASTRAPYISRKWMTTQLVPSLTALCVLLHAKVILITCVPTTGQTSPALTTNFRRVLSNWVETRSCRLPEDVILNRCLTLH